MSYLLLIYFQELVKDPVLSSWLLLLLREVHPKQILTLVIEILKKVRENKISILVQYCKVVLQSFEKWFQGWF